MTFGRPFRRPLTVDAALAELDRCAGTQFEPAVVRAFVDAYDAGDVDLRRRAS
jgi:response regulator RpfG family c-di-GMP phosphodiesterase